ncbi:MAG: CoA-transferase [Syntrophorhabdales bacterium]|jgi:acyl CoA:acetate/3-ketoacid CoA transferase alpha subunit/acyl CoA:acetate/3-ketoacid CoA transferase beta subunit
MINGKIFELDERKGQGKILPLREAIDRWVRPGMKLHFADGADANAAVREIIRQYHGKDPEFTLISGGVTTPDLISLVASGLVRKVVTTNCSYTYPAPRPIHLLQKMHKDGLIQIESWSLYSLEQRLMAAALGVGWMPTKSLKGSGLGEENGDSYKIVTNPFDATETMGVVRALSPDISIVHGCVADQEGNTILSPPYWSGLWGPRASNNGVIVTVERIVPTEFIRKHSALVKIPGFLVRAVCSVVFGTHPQGLAAESIDLNGYGEDYEFILDFVKASRDSKGLKEWMEEWIFQCRTQEEYVRKLGPARTSFLASKSTSGQPEPETREHVDRDGRAPYNRTEMMVVATAREIKEIVLLKDYSSILSGIGAPGLAAWLAFYLMKEAGIHIDLMTGVGQVGFSPRPADPFLMSLPNVMTSKMLTDTTDVYGTFVGGAHNRCLSVLGAAQIDQYGNINTVKVNDLYFIGVGGAADALNSCETIAVAKQSADRFLEKVPFVSCPGERIRTLVTDMGVFKKYDGNTFTLAKVFAPSHGAVDRDPVQEIASRCGWEVRAALSLEQIPPPTEEELSVLRALDPKGFFVGK